MNPEALSILAQFGPAGLIGLLWLAERRAAAARERRLREAHAALMQHRRSLAALLSVVKDNTRAIATLESTQRRLIELAERMLRAAGRSARHGPLRRDRTDQ